MAELINLAGTTSHLFTIGEDGITIFYGRANPTSAMGKVGDIYVQMTKEIAGVDTVDALTGEDSLETFKADWEGKHPGETLPINYAVKYTGDTGDKYYTWNGTSWDQSFKGTDELGRVYYKENCRINGVDTEQWSFIKTYSFDTEIIDAKETEQFSNNYKITLESADNNDGNIDPTSENDYEGNHSAYGVTRYASDDEVTVSAITNYKTYSSLPNNFDSLPEKFIAVTPKQLAEIVKVEMQRAINVEGYLKDLPATTNGRFSSSPNLVGAVKELDTDIGKLSSLTTSNKTSIVTAINSEVSRAKGVEGTITNLTNYSELTSANRNLVGGINKEIENRIAADDALQNQINTIVARKDVVDFVGTHADLLAYDTSTLTDNDIVVVLTDSTEQDQTVYWRYDKDAEDPHDPSACWVEVGVIAAYYTKQAANERFVNATENVTETISGNKTFSSNVTIPATPTANTHAASKKYVDDSISTYDATVVHTTGDETIEGTKTFKNKDVKIQSSTIDITDSTTGGDNSYLTLSLNDKNDVEMAHLKTSYKSGKITSELGVSKDGTAANLKTIGITVDQATGTATTTAPTPTDTTSTSSTQIATVGWVNSANNNVVHKTGNESISGTKTFTSNVVVPQTPTENTHATSKKYVDDKLAEKVNVTDLPRLSVTADGQVIACIKNPTTNEYEYNWKIIRDITTLGGLEDVAVDNEQNDQSLVFDSSVGENGAWVNKRPMIATISYW